MVSRQVVDKISQTANDIVRHLVEALRSKTDWFIGLSTKTKRSRRSVSLLCMLANRILFYNISKTILSNRKGNDSNG